MSCVYWFCILFLEGQAAWGCRKLTALVFQRRLIQHHPLVQIAKTRPRMWHITVTRILKSKHVMPLTGHCFFALIYNKHSFDVIVSVIFWPGLQVPIKFPFLQNNCGPGNHHHSLPLLLPARLWLPGPQQIQYHWFPLTATAVMMTSRKHWNWQKMLK